MQRVRKEISLDEETVTALEAQAKREGRKLKNYMEFVLKQQAMVIEPSSEYKAMMDDMLAKDEAGKLEFTTWVEVSKEFKL